MEKVIITQKDKEKMDNIYTGQNSNVYELNGDVYKFFSGQYMATNTKELLRAKIEIAEDLNIPKIVVPNGIIFDENDDFKGVRYPKVGKMYKPYSSDLKTYTKIHKQIKKILENASNEGVILTDFLGVKNLRLTDDGTIFVIDYDGMQVRNIPSSGRSQSYYNFSSNNPHLIGKYVDVFSLFTSGYNLCTKEVNVYNSIAFYIMDCLKLDIGAIPTKKEQLIIPLLGIKEDDINQKIWKIFSSHSNEYFTDDEFEFLCENYDLEPMPELDSCKRFVRK